MVRAVCEIAFHPERVAKSEFVWDAQRVSDGQPVHAGRQHAGMSHAGRLCGRERMVQSAAARMRVNAARPLPVSRVVRVACAMPSLSV